MDLFRSITPWRVVRNTALAAVAAVALVACGGGGDATDPAAPQGSAVGTVTGFGSLIVDGVTYDERGAQVVIDTVDGAPDAAAGAEAKLGQRVELKYSGVESRSAALHVSISAEVVGPVSAVSPDLVVAGQTIRINTDPAVGPVTVFDGYAGAADIRVGDRVEVHGTPIDARTVLASRIERKPALHAWVRVSGNIAGLATDGSSFTLGGLTVLVDVSTRISPAGATLADGKRVTVWSRNAPAANTITAAFVRIKRPPPDALLELRLAGAVTDCTAPCAANFKVAGFTIDASNAQFSGGAAANLANGRWVELRGRVDATSGVFVATKLRFRERDDERNDARLIGAITDFVDMQHFTVRGVAVSTDANTRLGSLCPAPLTNGTLVAVRGAVANATVLATRVDCLPSADGITVEARGTIATLDAAARTFTLGNSLHGNLTLRWTDATIFPAGKSAADLAVGAKVRLRGTVEGGVMTVARIQFDDDVVTNPFPGSTVYEIEGIAAEVVVSGGAVTSITVDGITVRIDATLVIDLRDGPLVAGAKVKIVFVRIAGVNVAILCRTDN